MKRVSVIMTSHGLTTITMIKHLFILYITLLIFLPTRTGDYIFAMDEGGCLTCHKYPGLVRFEKPDGFKVFHIDEEKYLKSAHGKIDCRKCHVSIVKVPHTGETRVDCTTAECHLSEKDKKAVESYDLSSLHKQEQFFIARLEDESSCRQCHPLYPHSENNLVRALLNMHTGFMICEVCHIKRDKFTNLSYEWTDSENAQFFGKPFGTYFNPKTGNAQKSERFISRIAVYTTEDGIKRSLMNTWDTGKAKLFTAERETLKTEGEKQQLKYFHDDISKKEISVACNECHSSNSIFDFNQLGFDEKKTKQLIYLNIKGLVTKYETFYFPRLFEE
jgi:hypothetical protein